MSVFNISTPSPSSLPGPGVSYKESHCHFGVHTRFDSRSLSSHVSRLSAPVLTSLMVLSPQVPLVSLPVLLDVLVDQGTLGTLLSSKVLLPLSPVSFVTLSGFLNLDRYFLRSALNSLHPRHLPVTC